LKKFSTHSGFTRASSAPTSNINALFSWSVFFICFSRPLKLYSMNAFAACLSLDKRTMLLSVHSFTSSTSVKPRMFGLLFTKDVAISVLSSAIFSAAENHFLKSLSSRLAIVRGERLNSAGIRGAPNLRMELSALSIKYLRCGSMGLNVSLELFIISITVLQSFFLIFSIISTNL